MQGSPLVHLDDLRNRTLRASIGAPNRRNCPVTVACGTATGNKDRTLWAEHPSARYNTPWCDLLAV